MTDAWPLLLAFGLPVCVWALGWAYIARQVAGIQEDIWKAQRRSRDFEPWKRVTHD